MGSGLCKNDVTIDVNIVYYLLIRIATLVLTKSVLGKVFIYLNM